MATTKMQLGSGDDAAVMEFETPEDAARFYRALRGTPQVTQPAKAATGRTIDLFGSPYTVPAFPKAAPKNPVRVVFKNGHYRAFEALYRAAASGLSSEELANCLELPSTKSLPPTVAAWGKRARSVGLDLKDLLDVERGYLGGKPHTTYVLTPKGREVFKPEVEIKPERTRAIDLSGDEVG